MLRFTQTQFVVLACLADYDFPAYDILSFARDLGYDIPLDDLFPTIQELINLGLIQEHKLYSSVQINVEYIKPIYSQTFELTEYGKMLLTEEMRRVDLLIKRIRKQVKQLT